MELLISDWERVQKLQEIGIKSILKDSVLRREYIKLHKKLFASNLCVSCNSVIRHSFNQFLKLTNSIIKIMKNRKYKFNDKVCLWIEGDRKHYTNENLTDEIAERILAKDPRVAKFFETLPEDWKDKAGVESVKTLSKMFKDELKVELAKLEGIEADEVTRVGKLKNTEMVEYIENYVEPEPASKEEDQTVKEDTEDPNDSTDGPDSAATAALKQMDEESLRKYAEDHSDKFPEWEKYKLKEKLLDYIISIV